MPGATEDTILKLQVTEVREDSVMMERDVESGPPLAIPMPNEAPRTPLLDNLSTMGKIVSKETITQKVKGKDAEVAVITLEAFGGSLKMYFTNAIPCMGLMKLQMGKATIMEAIEWGEGEKPAATEATPKQPAPKPAAKDTTASERTGPPAKLEGNNKGPQNPLYDAKVGEWVRLRSVVQGEETISTLKVVEVTDDEVKLESRVAYGDTEIKGAVLTRPRREHMPMAARGGRGKVEMGTATIEVKGQKLECITITRTTRRGGVDKRWYCKDIPVNGLVRHERGGKVVKELLDWGSSETQAPHGASK